MDQPSPEARMVTHLKEALTIADQLGLADVGIAIDSALTRASGEDTFLRDSAARIWVLPG